MLKAFPNNYVFEIEGSYSPQRLTTTGVKVQCKTAIDVHIRPLYIE